MKEFTITNQGWSPKGPGLEIWVTARRPAVLLIDFCFKHVLRAGVSLDIEQVKNAPAGTWGDLGFRLGPRTGRGMGYRGMEV